MQNQADKYKAGMVGNPDRPGVPRGPIGWLLNLFSSIWLGISLLTILFVYSSLGSAIPPIRQIRLFELTEYEWFHTWFFNTVIALICINIIITTLRRIRFKPVNYGVWMIHTGVIILCLGGVWYFGTKVEGEALIARRNVVLNLPGAEGPVTFLARPGNVASIQSPDARYFVQVSSIDPHWSLLSGPDKGRETYAVTLSIQRMATKTENDATDSNSIEPETFSFMRQLIAGYPEFTEDLIMTDDHAQPMQRVKKLNPDGNPLIDETFTASLEYCPENYFYLVNSAAIYVREVAPSGMPLTDWIERPISNLPRYNEYISSPELVWAAPDDPTPKLHPLDIEVAAASESGDPMAGADIVITDYLRYAMMNQRRTPGGDKLDPAVTLELSSADGRRARYELVALDPRRSMAESGRMLFMWADSQEEIDALGESPGPRLAVRVPDAQFEQEFDITTTVGMDPETPFISIGDTGYSMRVERVENNLQLQAGTTFSVAVVALRKPDGTEIRRLVQDNPDQPNVDFAVADVMTGHEQPLPLDESIQFTYLPSERPALVTIVAGPAEDELHVVHTPPTGETVVQPIALGDQVEIDKNISIKVISYTARSRVDERPAVIARAQREKNVGEQLSMIRVRVPVSTANESDKVQSVWLPFHLFPFNSSSEVGRRFRYEPKRVVLDDRGTESPDDDKVVELLFSRRRMPLPDPVVLDDFVLTTHTGGYLGTTAGIRNWTSVVRFGNEQDVRHQTWSEPLSVSVNEPIERDGYWFFQSQWDAPDARMGPNDRGSAGFNYTVLGVANRKGVNVMLAGCIVIVIGLIYAFYIKPHIKRRKLLEAQTLVEQQSAASAHTNGELVTRPAEPARPLSPVGSSHIEEQSQSS